MAAEAVAEMPVRPWLSAIAMLKWSWMSGAARFGSVLRKPPHSATFEVTMPTPSRR